MGHDCELVRLGVAHDAREPGAASGGSNWGLISGLLGVMMVIYWQVDHSEAEGATSMTQTPTDDRPGFVADEPKHCHACVRLIQPGQTYYLTIGQAILCEECTRTADAIRSTDAWSGSTAWAMNGRWRWSRWIGMASPPRRACGKAT